MKWKIKKSEKKMTKILFVCYGNICRSPMAEFIMKDLVEKAGKSDEFHIESAATSDENTGWGVYGPAKEQLEIDLTIRDAVKAHIVETGTNHKYGARPLRRAVQNQLEDKLAEAVLSGEIKRDTEVVVSISKKEIKFTCKTTKEK